MKGNEVENVSNGVSVEAQRSDEGRTVDQRVHEMMGLHWHTYDKQRPGGEGLCDCGRDTLSDDYANPAYFTDIQNAFRVVEWLREEGEGDVSFRIRSGKRGWWVDIEQCADTIGEADAPTLPEAICLAALKAVEATRNTTPTRRS